MDFLPLSIPLNFKREQFLINEQIVVSKFVKLSNPVFVDSFDFKVELNNNRIYKYQYDVVKITSDNIHFYPNTSIDDYIVTWLYHWGIQCEQYQPIISSDNIGQILEISYVVGYEAPEVVHEIIGVDNVSWEALMDKFVIEIITTGNGITDPIGIVHVSQNDNLYVTFIPDADYSVKDIILNGENLGYLENYTITHIDRNYTLVVNFTCEKHFLEILN